MTERIQEEVNKTMAARILLTTEELLSEAKELQSAVQKNQDVIQKCDSIVNGLLNGWEGDAQRAFAESWKTKRTALVRMTDGMKDLAVKISRFADTMGATEKRAQASAQHLATV